MTLFTNFLTSAWIPLALGIFLYHPKRPREFYVGLGLIFAALFLTATIAGNELTLLINVAFMALLFYFVMGCRLIELIYIPISYILIVLCDYGIESLCLTIFPISTETMLYEYPYSFYSVLLITVLVTILAFGGRFVIRTFKKRIRNPFHPSVLLLIGGNLILCAILFLVNSWAGRQNGFPESVLKTNLILFCIYAFSTILLSLFVFHTFAEKERIERKKEEYRQLQEYTNQVEQMYGQLRAFKHDYTNILLSISGYLSEQKYRELSEYFYQSILPDNQKLNQSQYRLHQLSHIQNPALKGLISSKLIYAHELGIHVYIDILDDIEQFYMDMVDLSRVIGIFLDNAIEAASESPEKELRFNAVCQPHSIAFVISNSFVDHQIPLKKLECMGVSTKGAHRGMGLHNVNTILSQYDNVFKNTTIADGFFIQNLHIQKK